MAATKKSKKIVRALVTHVVLIILLIICLMPIFLVVINSFKSNSEIISDPLALPKKLDTQNYSDAWKTGNFSVSFLNSIKLTGLTILIVLVCSTLAGYVLSGKRIKGSEVVITYFLMATTVPIQFFLFSLYFAYAKLGWIGNIPATSLILAATFMPLAVFLMRTFFLAVPKELEEAARIDGANTGQVIWNVMRPVVSPGLVTVGILIGLQAWNEYLISSTFLQGEENFTATLGFLSMNGSYGSNMGVLMAAAMILIVPVIVFFLLMQRQFIDGMVSGAVKG